MLLHFPDWVLHFVFVEEKVLMMFRVHVTSANLALKNSLSGQKFNLGGKLLAYLFDEFVMRAACNSTRRGIVSRKVFVARNSLVRLMGIRSAVICEWVHLNFILFNHFLEGYDCFLVTETRLWGEKPKREYRQAISSVIDRVSENWIWFWIFDFPPTASSSSLAF